MIDSMTTKITVSVPDELVEYIRGRVTAGEFDSVSAFVTRAAESLRDFDPLDLLIAGMVAETGEPDEDAQVWMEQAQATARVARRRRGLK
jgi:Arc/MetJ-type ribon-helix-helix transcriptional regulator